MLKQSMESTKRNLEAGFSLVELMVVVTIIGILAGVAVPKFQTFKARAVQTEAKAGLNGIYLSMQAYMANYNDYPAFPLAAAAGAPIGFALTGSRPKYTYQLVSTAEAATIPAHWAGKASSSSRLANNAVDSIRINTNKWQCSMFDAVQNTAGTATPNIRVAAVATDCPQNNTAANGTALALQATAGTGADLPE